MAEINRLSEFVEKLTGLQVQATQATRQIDQVEKRLESLQSISEKIVALELKVEALNNSIIREECRDNEIEDSLIRIERRVASNSDAIAHNMKEIERLYKQIDTTYLDINAKLDLLTASIKEDYLSNASFTKLQRNVLWGAISAAAALIVNYLLAQLSSG
jgi:predicted  nucleic acid-binding Zn-ribbon protein